MIKRVLLGAAVVGAISVGVVSCQPGCGTADVKLSSQVDSASYAIGMMVGKNQVDGIKQAPGGKDLNKAAIIAAFTNSFNEGESKMTEEQAQEVIQAYFEAAQTRVSEENKVAGEKFLTENKTKDGVITTESGLQYKVITEGTGEIPTAESTVSCHYTGKLLDGTVFDSSVERGEPTQFPVGGVIPGWTEALKMMPVGSKWELYIPSDLAYGERGAGGQISPNSTLVFEVELLEIVKEEK